MNNDDQKIKDLLTAYTKTPPSEAFVQNVMRQVRHQQTTPAWKQWFSFPRLALAGAGVAAFLVFLIPHGNSPVIPAEEAPAIVYTASLLEPAFDEDDAETEVGSLIETYFL